MIEKVIQSINRNLGEHDNLDTLSVHEIASEALKKIAKCQQRNSTPRDSEVGISEQKCNRGVHYRKFRRTNFSVDEIFGTKSKFGSFVRRNFHRFLNSPFNSQEKNI